MNPGVGKLHSSKLFILLCWRGFYRLLFTKLDLYYFKYMIQNILVVIFIGGAILNILHNFKKLWSQKKNGPPTCGGCSQCELKKNLVHHGQH